MKQLAFFMLTLAIVSAFVPENLAVGSTPDIEGRILRGIAFVKNDFHIGRDVSGYLHDENSSDKLAYTEDNALVALALSSYQESHFSSSYYADLQRAVEFVTSAQTAGGDFYWYYDFGNETWNSGGKFYYWNAIILMSIAYAAFTITNQVNSERAYWSPVVDKLRSCIDHWLPSSLGQSGGVVFVFPDGSRGTDLRYQGALMMGLMHLAAFEYYWGRKDVANRFVDYSRRMASWLFSLQERGSSHWGYGGFYSNPSMNLQTSEENAFSMFGLNSYYKVIGLIMATQRTELESMRNMMQEWEEGYVENIRDYRGGVSFGRGVNGTLPYPRLTWTASGTLAATVDVWINLGPEKYWNDSSRIYGWLTGNNERSTDLQTSQGNFYEGLDPNGALRTTDFATTVLTLYSLVRAAFVSIPGTYPVSFPNQKFTKTTSSTTMVPSQSTPSITHEAIAPPENLNLYVAAVLAVIGVLAGMFAFKWGARKKRKRSVRGPTRTRRR